MKTAAENSLAVFGGVVVDDEPLARAHLAHLLREAGVGRVYEAQDADQCLTLLRTSSVDWVFTDVRMPGTDGLTLADTLATARTGQAGQEGGPEVVFVTGYDDYAVQAFDRAAVDYLLKPAERGRLDETLRRLVSRAETPPPPSEPALPPLPRLPIRTDYATRLVDIGEIVAAVARDKRVEIITPDATYSTYYTLTGLENRLPAEKFLRVHESWIVNLTMVLEIHSLGSQAYQLKLRGGVPSVPVSRRRLPQLQQRFGL